MNAKWLPISAAVIMALGSASASAVDFHGYMRSGIGMNTDGGTQVCAQAANAPTKYRLGNECESYLELGLSQELYNKGNTKFAVNTMIASKSGNGNDWQDTRGTDDADGAHHAGHGDQIYDNNPWGNTAFAFRQANVEATGLFGGNEITWAGKKYYQRHDIHWMDLYYWNTSGYGAGVEQISVGKAGAISAAVLREVNEDGFGQHNVYNNGNSAIDKNVSVNNLDLRWAQIPLWTEASLEVGVNYFMPSLTDGQDTAKVNDDKAVMLTGEYTQGNFFGGFNKFTLQYADNGAAGQLFSNHAGSGFWGGDQSQRSSYRVIDWGTVAFNDKIEMGYSVVYADMDRGNESSDDNTWFSAGIRPMYKWDQVMKTVAEIGYDDTSIWGSKEKLQKYTLAQAWSAGNNIWARPEIRAYVTYATSDNDNKFGVGKNDNTSVGFQAEAWW
jgi:maltoporin